MNILFLIPARGGSKGIPGKNIKLLRGKPLINYSIDIARNFVNDEFICVSTDEDEIINVVENHNLKVLFKRPSKLSTDTSGSYQVILHALHFYEKKGTGVDCIILLQPTSPFRKKEHISQALKLYSDKVDMVVSVKKSKTNPYYNLYEEDKNGFLKISKKGNYNRRQDCPSIYEFNGSIYIINVSSLKKYNSIADFKKIKKYEMDEIHSTDIDVPLDWLWAEFLIKNKLVTEKQ